METRKLYIISDLLDYNTVEMVSMSRLLLGKQKFVNWLTLLQTAYRHIRFFISMDTSNDIYAANLNAELQSVSS